LFAVDRIQWHFDFLFNLCALLIIEVWSAEIGTVPNAAVSAAEAQQPILFIEGE